MNKETFNKLVGILIPDIKRNYAMSRSAEPVFPELIVACGLRFLRGAQVQDQKEYFGLSRAEVYASRNSFLKAVMVSDELQIKIPSTAEEWEKIRRGFMDKSSGNLISGCVGALDRFLQPIQAPTKKEALGNIDAYHSGHYDCHGLNCQALCDASLKFLFFGVVAP